MVIEAYLNKGESQKKGPLRMICTLIKLYFLKSRRLIKGTDLLNI